MTYRLPIALCGLLAFGALASTALATENPLSPVDRMTRQNPPAPAAAPSPAYVIGPEDVLSVVFWRDKEMTTDVVVRPDGKISLPVLNEIDAAGLTPEQLQQRILHAASRYVEHPSAPVIVKEIKSRRVFITGQVNKPGEYVLIGPMRVVQLIALAGGLQEFADGSHISVMRVDNGRQVAFPFNYDEVKNRKNLAQNIELKPGDTVIIP
jgi:polysaccharide export outer membrane protein